MSTPAPESFPPSRAAWSGRGSCGSAAGPGHLTPGYMASSGTPNRRCAALLSTSRGWPFLAADFCPMGRSSFPTIARKEGHADTPEYARANALPVCVRDRPSAAAGCRIGRRAHRPSQITSQSCGPDATRATPAARSKGQGLWQEERDPRRSCRDRHAGQPMTCFPCTGFHPKLAATAIRSGA
jgi:hypothetical protein